MLWLENTVQPSDRTAEAELPCWRFGLGDTQESKTGSLAAGQECRRRHSDRNTLQQPAIVGYQGETKLIGQDGKARIVIQARGFPVGEAPYVVYSRAERRAA